MKTENKDLIVGGAILVIGGIIYYFSNKKEEIVEEIPADIPVPNVIKPVVLNRNLLLKVGARGKEVVELQRLLGGLTTDGVFGNGTKNKLFETKGIYETTLNQYAKLPSVNNNLIPVGSRLMAYNSNVTKLYKAVKLANGTYSYSNTVEREINKGEEIGTLANYVLPTKTIILLRGKNIFGFETFYFVYAKDIRKI
jgi:hypothetical protein